MQKSHAKAAKAAVFRGFRATGVRASGFRSCAKT
jgi:hypothetical protein